MLLEVFPERRQRCKIRKEAGDAIVGMLAAKSKLKVNREALVPNNSAAAEPNLECAVQL